MIWHIKVWPKYNLSFGVQKRCSQNTKSHRQKVPQVTTSVVYGLAATPAYLYSRHLFMTSYPLHHVYNVLKIISCTHLCPEIKLIKQ